MKFLHTMVRAKDIKASLRFYVDFLGLEVDKISELEDCKLYFLKDEDGFAAIELTENFETPEGGYSVGSGFGHIALLAPNLDDVGTKLEKFGYEWLFEPFILNRIDEPDRKTKIAFIKDPDGYEIELIEK